MALAVSDLTEYRHRRETLREQNLRLEVEALSESIADFDRNTRPHRQRLYVVASECGPNAMASWNILEARIERLLRQSAPDDGNAA